MNRIKYDIVIAGGGTAGVSCAWNSAQKGLKTLLIEKNSFLGGSITSSLVIPAMKTSDNSINNDFFNALYDKLSIMGGAVTYCDGNKGWFNPELTKIALDIMMKEAGVEILFETKILSAHIEMIDDDNIFILEADKLSHPIETKYLVDATGDAKICEIFNCNFLENSDEFQPKSLRFIMSGVNVKEFSEWLLDFDKDRNVTTSCTIDDRVYLSTAYTWDNNIKWALKPLFEKGIDEGVIKVEDSNYFQIFSVAGTTDSITFNAPRLLDPDDSYSEARLSIFRLSNFCKKYLPGFKNAYISNIANSMGIRVSRRVKGKYIYTYEDLIEGKIFKTPVLISNYPVDIHSNKKNCSTLQKIYREYQLPIEALMVDNINNLFVIGRCISADFKSQGALRIIPSCFSMGEGLAKYLSEIQL